MTAGVRLFLFGGFRLENARGEVLSISLRKAEALLAYLAMAPGKTAPREKLATLLWGESDQQRARQSLRQALFALTRTFAQAEISVLRMESQMVSLDPAAIWVDVAEFGALIDSDETGGLRQATAYYTGPFLQDFTVDSPDFDDWLMAVQGRLEETALKTFVELLDRQEGAGDHAVAIETAQGALRIDGYREDIHRRLMRLYMASGMRSSALHQYRLCHDYLERELGVPPDEETSALYKKILDAGPSTAPEPEPPSKAHAAPTAAVERARARVAHTATVGRAREARELDRHLREARAGRSKLVVVTGEVGVGKTRLLEDFIGDLAGQGAIGLLARGRRTERSLALGLWSDLLSQDALAEDRERDTALSEAAREQVARFLPDRFVDADDSGAARGRPRFYDAVVELIRARSARRPLVLAFDDLHWADAESIRLLAFALRHLGDAPVVFVAALPPEELGRGLPADLLRDLDRDGLASLLTLQPLTREETGELLHELQDAAAGKASAKLKASEVWALSEGNPRIVTEIVALNAGTGGAARGQGVRLPERVFAEVAQTMAPLGEAARDLANLASVIGPRVDYEVLRHSAALGPDALVSCVEELVAAGILSSDGDDLVFGRERIRVALYEGLLPQRRRSLHAAVARTIEELHAGALEPQLGVLADHYREAGDATASLERELAAASVELKRGGRSTARKLFQRALKSVQDLQGEAGARALEAEARLGLGEIAEAERDLETAAAIFGDVESHLHRVEDPRRRTAALLALSRIHYLQKDEEGAYEHARRALKEAQRAGGDGVWTPADSLLIRIHLVTGAFDETIDRLTRHRDRAKKLDLREDEADAVAAIGLLHAVQGDFAAAAEHCLRAVELAEGLGNERCLAAALQFNAMVANWRGVLDDALADYDKARAIAIERGDVLRLYALTGHRGFALATAKNFEAAVAELRLALDMGARLETMILRPLFMAWLAEASFEAGQHEDALHYGREASRLAAEHNQPWARSVALRALARVLAHPDVRDLAGAERSIRNALADQEGLGIKFETARSMIVHARIMRSAGNTRQSSAVYDEASKMFQQMQMTGEFDSARHMAEALRPGSE